MGSSSHNAVFEEIQGQIRVPDTYPSTCTLNQDEEARAELLNNRDSTKIKAGVEILQLTCNLYEVELFDALIARWSGLNGCSLVGPFAEVCYKSVQDLAVRMKQVNHSKAEMHSLSEQILRNTLHQSCEVDENTTFEEWVTTFTGECIRWETVGLVLTIVGLSAVQLHPSDSLFRGRGGKQKLCRQMLDSGDACLACCDAEQLNDVRLWLLFENMIFNSLYYGDSSFHTWRKVGDLSSEVFALGLHQELKPGPNLPLFLAEMRKRTFANIYVQDKMLATFTGRPCRISRKFCVLQLPLDLDLQHLKLPRDELRSLMDKLDNEGWNFKESNRTTRWIRTSTTNSVVREDILELVLGSETGDIESRVSTLKKQAEDHWAELPDFVRYDRSIQLSGRGHMGDTAHISCPADMINCYLDHIYNLFLIERTAVKRLKCSSVALLGHAREIMRLLLDIINLRGEEELAAGDIAWHYSAYGLPAAGVLALELLQQTRQPVSNSSLELPRSEVIQSLSIFVSHLLTIIPPGEGNYALLYQARKMLQAILDAVLTTPRPPRQDLFSYNAQQESHQVLPLDPLADGIGNDWSWYDQVDFNGDFWNNVADHPLLAPYENTV